VLGLTIVTCALLSRGRDRRRGLADPVHGGAFATGIGAVSVLWLLGGAAANAVMLATGSTYTGFADGSPIPFVHDTWESLVVPHHHVFIGLLIAGEALAGLLVLVPGRVREYDLLALVAFNATLVVFGWGFAIWAVPMVCALLLLHRTAGERDPRQHPGSSRHPRLRTRRHRPSGGASSGRHRSPRSRVPSP
jgi:hypothetical protein